MSENVFKYRIKEMRVQKGMSQEELAASLGLTRTAVSAYEIGRNEPPYDILIKLGELFDCSIDYFLGKTNEKHPINTFNSQLIIKPTPRVPFAELDNLPKEAQEKITEYYEMIVAKYLGADKS